MDEALVEKAWLIASPRGLTLSPDGQTATGVWQSPVTRDSFRAAIQAIAPAIEAAAFERAVAAMIEALQSEQKRLDEELYLMDTSDCVNVIRETCAAIRSLTEKQNGT